MASNAKKYGKILIKGSLAVSMAEAGTKLISLLLLPIFTHYLSPEDFGVVSMVTLVVAVLTLVFNPGMQSATIRLYHATESDKVRQTLIGSAYWFYVFAPALFLATSLLFGPWLFSIIFNDFNFYPFGFLAVALTLFSQSKKIWTALLTLQYKIHIIAIYSVVSVLLGISVSILFVVVFNLGVWGKVLGMFPPSMLFFVLSFTTIRKYSKGLWSFESMKKQLVFGFPLIFAIISYQILHIADRYMLEKMSTLESVGIYSLGYTLASIPMFLVLGIKQLWSPMFYENMNNGDYDTISKIARIYLVILSSINILVILFCREVIVLLINSRFWDAIPIIGVIVIGVYFSGLLTFTNSFLSYENKFGKISQIAFVAALLNILLNLVLIPIIDIMGAALATLLSYFAYFIISALISKKSTKLIMPARVLLFNILMVVMVFFVTHFANCFYGTEVNLWALVLKTALLLIIVVLFFVFKLITLKEVNFVKKSIVEMIQRKGQ